MNFLSYIQGKRYGEEAHWLEKEALSDPFLQDAIDGYDKVNDRPSYHLKKLEKRLTRRTKRKFYFLRFWGIVVAILIIIFLSILFFFNNRVNVLRNTAFLENHTDGIISNYDKDSVQQVKDSLLRVKSSLQQTKDSVIATNQIINNRIVQPEETEKFKKNTEAGQDNAYEDQGQYTFSNEETQTQLLDDNKSQEINKPADIPDQSQTQTQTQIPKPENGSKAYNDYIEQNRRQLSDANSENQHGKVILMFHVNNQGRPVDIAILRSLCPEADREAIRLLQNGPNWTVGELLARLEVAF